MLPRLRLRKTCKRLIHNSRGFSSIVGAVFAALIMISLIATVFVWTLSQNTSYNNSVRQSNQADLDRSNEKILTNVTAYGDSANLVWVNGTLENDGPLSVHLTTLWVVVANETSASYAHLPADITLAPGSVTTLSGSEVNVTIPNSAADSLSCWFISERGNTISKYGVGDTTTIVYPSTQINNTIYAQVSQGIGAVAMDFDDFRYYHAEKIGPTWWINSSSAELPDGTGGYYLTDTQDHGVVFRLNLTNWDAQMRNITITSHSAFWMISPTSNPQQPRSDWWYVVNVEPDMGVIVSTTASWWRNVTLPYGVPTSVYFASTADVATLSTATKFAVNVPSVGNAGAVNLMLFGNIGDGYYGQNLPFVSMYVAS